MVVKQLEEYDRVRIFLGRALGLQQSRFAVNDRLAGYKWSWLKSLGQSRLISWGWSGEAITRVMPNSFARIQSNRKWLTINVIQLVWPADWLASQYCHWPLDSLKFNRRERTNRDWPLLRLQLDRSTSGGSFRLEHPTETDHCSFEWLDRQLNS